MKVIAVILPVGLALLLAACGGGGGGDGGGFRFTSAQALPGGDGDPKQLRIQWSVRGQADGFRLEFNPDGASGFTSLEAPMSISDFRQHPLQYFAPLDAPIAGGASSLELDAALHLLQWQRARLQLVALDAGGAALARSEEIPLDRVTVEPMVGRFRAFNSAQADFERPGDRFGVALALSDAGDILAVGAPGDRSGSADPTDTGAPGAGAVFIHRRNGDGWGTHYLKSGSPRAGGAFGAALALSGDGNWLAVSAPGESYAGEDFFGGAVYLFARDGDDWQQRARLTLDPQQYPTARFAHNLALSGDGSLLAAGDLFTAVFVYSLDGGQVLETQVLPQHPDEDAHRAFAQSLAVTADGDLLLVGAMEVAEISDSPISVDYKDGGAVYAYRRLGGQWQRSAVIEGQPGDGFGSALAVSALGNRLAVAAINDHSIGSGVEPPVTALANVPSGAVYVYRDTGTGWQREAFIKPTNNAGGFLFGQSLALSAGGSYLAVGAPREPAGATGVSADPAADQGAPDSGAGYMFLYENGSWRVGNYLKSPETACGENFGAAAAMAAGGRTLAMSAVPGTPPQLTVDASGEAAFGIDICPGQAGEPPLHGAVYIY